MQGYFSATDAAKYLGISRPTFYKWKEKFHIKPIFVEGIGRYSKKSLDALMESKR